MIKQELDRIKERISNKDFLENKGLSNEVGIHVFCYKAEDELNSPSWQGELPVWRSSATDPEDTFCLVFLLTLQLISECACPPKGRETLHKGRTQ